MTTAITTKVENVTAEQFNQIITENSGKVLVDFYAPWCAPCKMIAPVVDQIATDHNDIKVIKVNADDNEALMAQYGVRGIPTLLLLEEGQVIGSQVGAATVKQVTDFITKH